MSLYLKWILIGKIVLSLDFWSLPTVFIFLIDAFRPLTFKVITDIGGLIFAIVFYSLTLFFGPIFAFHSSSAFCDLN